MSRTTVMPFVLCLCSIGLSACNKNQSSPAPGVAGIPTTDLVGKWRLVKADGKPIGELSLKSHELDLAADGTWTSNIVFGGQMEGMTMKGGGKWSVEGESINYTNGQ